MSQSHLRDPWEELLARLARGELSSHQVLAAWHEQQAAPGGSPAHQQARAEPAPGDPALVEEAFRELRKLTGLREVSELARELAALVEVQRRRRAHGLRAEPLVFHMVFTGNPGTGKT
ncbi:MAG TPA: hypothetical protein VIL08_01000, partial [Limnochorda sp.]